MAQSRRKPKKDSMIDFTKKYANNYEACVEFFFDLKWPDGFYCDQCNSTHCYKINGRNVFECQKCHKQHSLLAGTIFQDCKLDLYKLILGIFLFFTSNKGVTGIEISSALDINYKSALLLIRKCRILMSQSNSEKVLDSMFYEADASYIGSVSEGKVGRSSDKQPFLIVLSTDQENQFPRFIKLRLIKTDSKDVMTSNIKKCCVLGTDRTLSTDGTNTYNDLKEYINVKNEKVDYKSEGHRLKWINIIIGNIQNNIVGLYHGVQKRDLPLFLNEQEWRYNHRSSGNKIMDKVKRYIRESTPVTKKQISNVLDLSEPYFART